MTRIKTVLIILFGLVIISQGCITGYDTFLGHDKREGGLLLFAGDMALGYSITYDKDREPTNNLIYGIGSGLVVFIVDVFLDISLYGFHIFH